MRIRSLILAVLMSAVVTPAIASPIQYEVVGRLFENTTGITWDLTGSFTLSDPHGSIWDPDPVHPVYEWSYQLSNLVLRTEAETFTNPQAGGSFNLRDGYVTDSYFQFSLGGRYRMPSIYNNVSFGGTGCGNPLNASCYGAQPDVIHFLFSDNASLYSRSMNQPPQYSFREVSAHRVPEPTGLALLGLGAAIFGVTRRRKRQSKID